MRVDSSVVGERAGGAGGGASRPGDETSVIRCGDSERLLTLSIKKKNWFVFKITHKLQLHMI